jgi:hypothetical protein
MTTWIFGVLLVGFGAAALTTWLRRGVKRRAESIPRGHNDPSSELKAQTHDVMTTSAGTRLLLRGGRLALPEASDVARRPGDGAKL